MKKLSIFLMLALLLGLTSSAMAEVSYTTIIQNLLEAQGITCITDQQIDASLVSYETYGAGTYTVHGFGKQASLNQVSSAYSPSAAFADVPIFSTPTNSEGVLIDPGVIFSFTTSGEWGFKGANVNGDYFYSQTSRNADGKVHWKLFCLEPLGFDIGFAAFEDGTDFDYNDLVLKVCPNPAPIPGSLLLLGSGLIGLLGLRRKMVA